MATPRRLPVQLGTALGLLGAGVLFVLALFFIHLAQIGDATSAQPKMTAAAFRSECSLITDDAFRSECFQQAGEAKGASTGWRSN
jgi:hypothetical protein